MRITSKKQLNEMVIAGRVGKGMAQQIEAEIDKSSKVSPPASKVARKAASTLPAERSPGELALRPLLADRFGWWHQGGELVEELEPFSDRKFRVDFALPRWQIYIEVDGWSHHGVHLDSHHRDRARGLYFSARNWLPFRVSYQQAINEGFQLIDCLVEAMEIRTPVSAGAIRVDVTDTPTGFRRRLVTD
ncbi:hypothetical protein EZI54_06885 [Marinobacter halodurans]|uniref:DUF559 domain-containing protein n=1 Tax=Marinobacter halodurans TaxID=2528979 RepID=A0ABY1ZMG5_9GAMM|nr:hypothetical protein [Marinobacter halodurans]TBW57376.1 hypothetical protein EZI54_06885 [Marinobacter halodurans]